MDKSYFKKLLLDMKQEMERQREGNVKELSENIRDASGEHSSYAFHLADLGTDTMEREKTFWRASVDRGLLNDVYDAIEKIEKGEYGYCESCEQPISQQRLEAIPHAKLCLDCKSIEEKLKS